ncbi:hypothetical protein M3Y97_00409300 [Aphelenchoides bicaudatus]|nr:hypothetical protein M3Y97_00409300 [Aphelenchoides bicaudatus]
MTSNLPSTSAPPVTSAQFSERRIKLASRHVSPISDDDDEMDEYAPIRLTILLSVILFGLLIYVLVKWRKNAKTRMPIRQNNKDSKSGWTDALLEEVSSDDDLILTR